MYCHVQREQDNKAQITGTNSCPLSLNHSNRYKYNAMHLAFDAKLAFDLICLDGDFR